jgi:hypothetical protein
VIPVALESGAGPSKRGLGARATKVAVIPVAVESGSRASKSTPPRGRKAQRRKPAAIPVAIQRSKSQTKRATKAKTTAQQPPLGGINQAVKQAVDLETNALETAGALSLAAIDTMQTAATLLLTPAAILSGRPPIPRSAREPARLLAPLSPSSSFARAA